MKEVKLRRYRNLLTISGLGVIAFGLWSVLKTIMIMLLREDVREYIRQIMPDNTTVKLVVFGMLGGVLLFDLLLRLYVGLTARSEGFGKKKGYAYIVLAILMALGSVASIVILFSDASSQDPLEMIVSFIVEATSLVILIELLVAAFTVKKLTKECGEVQ